MTEQRETTVAQYGFTPFAEKLNGRVAMVGFVLAVVTELLTGQGIVGQVSALFGF